MEYNAYHIPVMPTECIDALNIKSEGVYVDCTLGGGGHTELILERLKTGRVIAFDKDLEAIKFCTQRLKKYSDKLTLINSDFKNIKSCLANIGITKVDGILADLGVSSRQLDDGERGFSYIRDAKLDMRMDQSQTLTAWKVVNEYSEERLFKIIKEYGEDIFAKNIAKNIVIARENKPIDTTTELVKIIDESIPYAMKKKGGHPAKRTFQAIRIEVNGELEGLGQALEDMIELLSPGGRIAVLTFHSLEDRIVKTVFNEKSKGCICPKSFPVCVCGNKPQIKLIDKGTAGNAELEKNPRAASARLRSAEKI